MFDIYCRFDRHLKHKLRCRSLFFCFYFFNLPTNKQLKQKNKKQIFVFVPLIYIYYWIIKQQNKYLSQSLFIKAHCSLTDMTLVSQLMYLLKYDFKNRREQIKTFLEQEIFRSKKNISRSRKSFLDIEINKNTFYAKN